MNSLLPVQYQCCGMLVVYFRITSCQWIDSAFFQIDYLHVAFVFVCITGSKLWSCICSISFSQKVSAFFLGKSKCNFLQRWSNGPAVHWILFARWKTQEHLHSVQGLRTDLAAKGQFRWQCQDHHDSQSVYKSL